MKIEKIIFLLKKMVFNFTVAEFGGSKEVKEWFIQTIKDYGFPDYKNTFGRGTFAVVYLKDNKIYRFSPITGTIFGTDRLFKNYKLLSSTAFTAGLGPKVYEIKKIKHPKEKWYILFSVHEKVNFIPWKEWNTIYNSEKDLINDFLNIFVKMKDSGIVHRDLSPNNVLLTQEKIVFIDWDDGCCEKSDFNCNENVIGTPGMVAPEHAFQTDGIARGKHASMMKEFFLREYNLDYNKKSQKIILKNNSFKGVLISSLYSFASICYYAFTGIDPGDIDSKTKKMKGYDLKLLSPSVRNILKGFLNPNPVERYNYFEKYLTISSS